MPPASPQQAAPAPGAARAAPQAPAARALRLAWALPPDSPQPAWLAACAAALAALQAAHADACDIGFAPLPAATLAGAASARAAAGPGPGAAAPIPPAPLQLKLHLGPAPLPGPADKAPDWWLTDGRGRALDAHHPLLDDITAGHGLALALWQPRPQGDGWVCVRRLHIDAGTHHARALRALPAVAAGLLWQAGRDLLLGASPSRPVFPSPRSTGHPIGKARGMGMGSGTGNAPRPWPAAALRLRGRWKAWLARQHARWWREEWRIGIIEQPLSALTYCRKALAPHWLPASTSHGYWADPAAHADSNSRILVEYFDENSGVGHIEQLRLNASHGVTDRQVLPLGRGRHASFPLAVQLDGRWLGLAETAALRRCELHEIDAQGQWRLLATLLPGVAAADPALFQWEGRYWLACTDIDQGAMDNLCLYYADRPEGPWLPHANNPVKVDVTGARMAGALFWHEGRLYRPAQNCLGTYGAGVVLQRVLHCSPTRYEEETVRLIEPDHRGPCPHGLHTLNAWGNRTLVDGKRHVFSLRLGLMKLRRRLRPGAVPEGRPT